jgi:hypothetical protein
MSKKKLRNTLWYRPYVSGLTVTLFGPSLSSMAKNTKPLAVVGRCPGTTSGGGSLSRLRILSGLVTI